MRDLLSSGGVARRSGPEATLLDLATRQPGLPRLPGNLRLNANAANPSADHGAEDLCAKLGDRGVALPQSASYLYGSLG